MGGKANLARGQHLRVSIAYPSFKLDLETVNAGASLREVRRIIELLADPPENTMEEASLYELRNRLSEEFFNHPDLMARVKNALVLEEDIRILKRTIPYDQEYDLDNGRESRQVNVFSVKGSITDLFSIIDIHKVRECHVHIRGELSREQQCVVMDAIKQHLGMGIRTRFFSTTKNLEGNVLVEAVCFGEGIADEW